MENNQQHHNFNEILQSSTPDNSYDIPEIVPVKNEVFTDDDDDDHDQDYVDFGNILPGGGQEKLQKYEELLSTMMRKIDKDPNYSYQCIVCERKYKLHERSNLKNHIERHNKKTKRINDLAHESSLHSGHFNLKEGTKKNIFHMTLY